MAAIIMGIAAGTVCYACVAFKNARKWDDALDVWGIHGMGGLTGAILTGTLASPHIWDTGDGIGAWTGTPEGMETQAISIRSSYLNWICIWCNHCNPKGNGRSMARRNQSHSKRRGDWSRFGTTWRKSIRKRIEKTLFFFFLFNYLLHCV